MKRKTVITLTIFSIKYLHGVACSKALSTVHLSDGVPEGETKGRIDDTKHDTHTQTCHQTALHGHLASTFQVGAIPAIKIYF